VHERVDLPTGPWQAGSPGPLRSVLVRAVGDADDEFLLESAELPPFARADALLARCVDGIEVGTLTVGDRDALLLHLRRLTFDERLECVLHCPVPDCAEAIELELRVSDLLVAPPADAAPTHIIRAGGVDVEFRLPRVGDLDALSAATEEARAVELLDRCIVSPVPMPKEARDAVIDAMAEHDPQAELELEITCPTCEREFMALFDCASFLLEELDRRAHQLLREVHSLARHYHWAEREILALPAQRRARYLDLIAGGTGT